MRLTWRIYLTRNSTNLSINLPLHLSGCSANQRSSATLVVREDKRLLKNGTFALPFNSTCQWNITAPAGKVLRIDVQIFNFSNPCDQEYLRIHDGPSESSNMLAEYCLNGSRGSSDKFLSSGHSLWIEAKRGLNNSHSHVQVYYKAIKFEGKGNHNFKKNDRC